MFSVQVGVVFLLGKGQDYTGGVFNNMTKEVGLAKNKTDFYFNKRFSNVGAEAANDMCSDSSDPSPGLSRTLSNSDALLLNVSELLKRSITGPMQRVVISETFRNSLRKLTKRAACLKPLLPDVCGDAVFWVWSLK